MSILVLKNKRLITYFNNLGSRSLGFYFSFLLHFALLIISLGMPNFFDPEPISLPNIIPIEIINVTDTTSIPKKIVEKKPEKKANKNLLENKKFNNSNNQQIKKIELKEKPEVKNIDSEVLNTPKEDIIIKEKVKTPIKLEKEKKNCF